MDTKKLETYSWRFFLFETNDKKFCFDCFTYKIYSLSQGLYNLLERVDFRLIKKQFPIFYKKVIIKPEIKDKGKKRKHEKQCNVTINISNKCNLNCIYCYRNKNETSFLTESDLNEIIRYIKFDYMPDATGYSLTLCNTSESSLDLKKLIYVDSLIAEFEGYLFSRDNISEKKLIQLYEYLPDFIKSKYSLKNGFETLNNILKNEKLWEVYDFSNNEYLMSVLTGKNELSLARRVMANRQILNKTFSNLDLERPIKYISLWFMTNGTNITDEYIHFLKSIFMKEVTVSIDGNEEVHNFSRKYPDGKGSFSDTLAGINKLRNNGIEVIASITITPAYPDFKKIMDFLASIGIKKINFNLVRGTKDNTYFSEDAIRKLIGSWRQLFELVYNEIKTNNYHYVLLLKGSYAFSILYGLYFRIYRTTRCGWGNEIVIDSKGNMYHCSSTIGCHDDYLGNYKDRKNYKQLMSETKNINKDMRCINCFAKYLCGGTCYANDVLKNTNGRNQECVYKKELIKASLELYAKLHKNGLLKKFISVIY